MRCSKERGFTTSHVIVLCLVAAVIGFFLYSSSKNQGNDYQAVLNAGQEDPPALSALAAVMDQRQEQRQQQATGRVNQSPVQQEAIPPFNPRITAVRADFLVGTDRRGRKEFDEELFVKVKFYVLDENLRSVQILRGDNHFMDANPQPVSKKPGNKWLYFWTDRMKLPNMYIVLATDKYDQTYKKVYHLDQPRKAAWVYQAGPKHYTLKLSRSDNRAVDDILMSMGPKRYRKKKGKKKAPGGFTPSSRTF